MTNPTFTESFSKTQELVEAGRIHWGALTALVRDRIMRLNETIRDVPGLAPVYGKDRFIAERNEMIALLGALRAKYAAR